MSRIEEDNQDGMYRLSYRGKWMQPKKMLGTAIFELFDNPEDVQAMSYRKATAARALVSDDNALDIEEVKLIVVTTI